MPISALSVSSSCSSSAGQPGLVEDRGDVVDEAGSRSCRAATLTLISGRVAGSAAAHPAACRQACASTHRPSGTMNPLSSASGTKRPGSSRLPPGSVQRTSASTPIAGAVGQLHQGLVLQAELAAGQRLGHAGRDREAVDVAAVAVLVEHRVPVAAVGLGPVERGVGRLHQLGGVVAAVGAHHADARRHGDLVVVEPHRAAHGGQRPPGPPGAACRRPRRARPGPRTRRRPCGPPGAGRRAPRSGRCATIRSRASPLSCPRVSLTALNPSRSR